MTLCSYLDTMVDEIKAAELAAGHDYFDREKTIRPLGRIHYAIWMNDIHTEERIDLGDLLIISFECFANALCDAVRSPFKTVICRRG